MEELSAQQQQELTKMSSDRLRMRLAKAGYDEDKISSLDRKTLQDVNAKC